MWHINIQRCIHTANLGFPSQIIKRYVLDTIILQTRSEVKIKVTQKWNVTLRHQKLHPHTIVGIPTFNNIRDILRTQFFLKTRSEVTVTHKWYKTLHHPKMHSHTKIGIPISNNIRDMLLTQLLIKQGQRSRSQWPENGKWHSSIPRCIYTPKLEFLPQRI